MKRKILHQPIIKMGAKMDNNQTNETKKSIWVESKWESKIIFIGAWGFFSYYYLFNYRL